MKKSILLLLLSMGSLVLVAQDCNLIRQKIKTSLNTRALDEALIQVKALRACDVSANGKKEADDWTEQIFLLLQERQKQAKIAEQNAKVNAEQAQRDAERAEAARLEAEIERNKAVAAQKEAALKVQERDLAEEERALALQRRVQQIRVIDLQRLGRNRIDEQDYNSAIYYFNQALSLISKDTLKWPDYKIDSFRIQSDIVFSEKVLAMKSAIQQLHQNMDSIAQGKQFNFLPSIQNLRMAMVRSLIATEGCLSYRADSLAFIDELGRLLLKARSYRSSILSMFSIERLEAELKIGIAIADLEYLLGHFQKAQRKISSMLLFQQQTVMMLKYTDNSFLQKKIIARNQSFWNRWEIGLSVKSYSGIGINKTYVKFPNGESVKLEKTTASFKSFPIELSATFYFDKKNSIGIYNRFSKHIYTQFVRTKENRFFDEDNFYLDNIGSERSLIYSREIYNLNRRRSKTKVLSLQACTGVTIGTSNLRDNSSFGGFLSFNGFVHTSDAFGGDTTALFEFWDILYRDSHKIELNDLNNTKIEFNTDILVLKYNFKSLYVNIPFGFKINFFPLKYRLHFSTTIAYNLPVTFNNIAILGMEIKRKNIFPPHYQQIYEKYYADRLEARYNFSKPNQIFSGGLSMSFEIAIRL